jgi:membrane protease YdiL (CAAX protease family)
MNPNGGEPVTEHRERPIDPYDPAKAHLLGMLFIFLIVLINRDIGGWLPGTMLFCLASWIIISNKGASPAQVFRLNRVSPAILAFPIALALVIWSAETLVLEGIDLATGGALGRWAELFPSPMDKSLPISELLSLCIIVPITEEMYWRGFFPYALKPLGPGWAAVLPAAFFALLHHPVAIGGAFLVGLITAALTARYGSILPAIVFHATGNGYACLLTAIHNRYGAGVAEALYYAICASGVLLALKIRPELSRLWADIKQVLRDFGSRPAFAKNFRLLFKHWSYILLVLEIAFTIAFVVITTTRGTPL